MKDMTPIGNNVCIRLVTPEELSGNVLQVAEEMPSSLWAKVVSAGARCNLVEKDDRVLISGKIMNRNFAGKYLLIPEEEILAVAG